MGWVWDFNFQDGRERDSRHFYHLLKIHVPNQTFTKPEVKEESRERGFEGGATSGRCWGGGGGDPAKMVA